MWLTVKDDYRTHSSGAHPISPAALVPRKRASVAAAAKENTCELFEPPRLCQQVHAGVTLVWRVLISLSRCCSVGVSVKDVPAPAHRGKVCRRMLARPACRLGGSDGRNDSPVLTPTQLGTSRRVACMQHGPCGAVAFLLPLRSRLSRLVDRPFHNRAPLCDSHTCTARGKAH